MSSRRQSSRGATVDQQSYAIYKFGLVLAERRDIMDDGALRSRLTEHSAYLERLISMVPAKYYLPPDPEEMARKFQKYTGKVPQAPKHERKLAAKERKRARLDPGQQLSASEIEQQRNAAADAADGFGAAKTSRKARQQHTSMGQPACSDHSDDEDDDDETPTGEDYGDGSRDSDTYLGDADGSSSGPIPGKPPLLAGPQLGPDGRPLSADGLKQRLSDKLQAMRASRGGTAKAPGQRAAEANAKGKGKQPKHVAAGKKRSAEEALGGAGEGSAPAGRSNGAAGRRGGQRHEDAGGMASRH